MPTKEVKTYKYQLSASKLNLFNEDPRVFWLVMHGHLKEPGRPFPSITGGIDRVMKEMCDQYRGGLPPCLEGKMPGVLMHDQDLMKKWRHWKSGLQATVMVKDIEVRIIGALDEVLIETPNIPWGSTETFSPLDHKSKGKEPMDDGAQYYQAQSDIYGLLLDSNGYPISGKTYLHYCWPIEVKDWQVRDVPAIPMKFGSKVFALRSDPKEAIKLIELAVACLERATPPPASGNLSWFGEQYGAYTWGDHSKLNPVIRQEQEEGVSQR